jgi:hypothetical protein
MEKPMAELTQQDIEKLATFDPQKPLIIPAASIAGLENEMGRFVFRRPTVGDQLKIGIRTSKLKENAELDTPTDNIAFILATFAVVCSEKPQGFEFEETYDMTPLYELFAKYSEWLDLFRLKLQATKDVGGGKGQ